MKHKPLHISRCLFIGCLLVACIVLSLLLFSTLSVALDDEQIYRSDELLIRQTTTGSIDINNPANLQSLTARLHLLPIEDYRQVVVEQTNTPQPQFVDESLVQFKFTKPIPNHLAFSTDTLVRTRNTYKQITRVVAFPISENDLSDDLVSYLTYTDLIDTNSQIRAKAKEIAGNSNDLFVVAFNVAQWVSNNIDYDLQTITADATQKSSWVYAQRRGVCDELSVLYASMMRSLGVPTRFVSGFSYTNSPLFTQSWNAHAWVEVYFPDYGWVPFDLTYKQFGFIDASHIALQTAADANDSATQYNWQGYDIDSVLITPSDLKFNATLIDARSVIEDFAKPTVTLLRDQVSLTSYSAIVVKLQNTKNYYISAQLGVSAPVELLFSGGRQIQLLLRPFEEKTVFIPVSVAPGLSSQYTYQFPVAVTNFYRILSNTTLYVSPTNPTYGEAEIKAMSANALAATQSSLNAFMKPQCYVAGNVRVNETVNFVCDITNDATISLSDFALCVNGSCVKESLAPKSSKTFSFPIKFNSVGIKQVPVRITVNSKVVETITDVTVLDSPSVSIVVISAPTTLEYSQSGTVRLLLQKNSFVSPKHTVVRIFEDVPYIWNVGTLSLNKELTVDISGSTLRPGVNVVPISATFTDDDGTEFSYKTNITLELTGVTLWQRFIIFVSNLLV